MGQMDDIAAIRAMVEAMQRKLDAVVMQPRPEWVTVHEYAEHHGVTIRTVQRWVAEGMIDTYRNGSKVMCRLGVSPDRRRSRGNTSEASASRGAQ